MLKLAILLTVFAISCASDVDDIIGEATPIAAVVTPSDNVFNNKYPLCASYVINKSITKCTCKDKADLTLVFMTRENSEFAEEVLPIVVSNKNEVAAAAEIKSADCSCDGVSNPDVGVIEIVNDNYFITHLAFSNNGNQQRVNVLNRKRVDSRADFDAVIKAIDFDKSNYTSLCNEFAG